jgi:hypothetical protein
LAPPQPLVGPMKRSRLTTATTRLSVVTLLPSDDRQSVPQSAIRVRTIHTLIYGLP